VKGGKFMRTGNVKQFGFLDLSGTPKVRIRSIPPSSTDSPEPEPRRKVLVQTPRARELNFYIVLEIIEQQGGDFVNKVVGPEGYEGPRDTIFPGEYLRFEFDGMTLDDLVQFERKNIAYVV
jgi:hypothetical protein